MIDLMTLKNKQQKRIDQEIHSMKVLDIEHKRLAVENALLLDLAYDVASSKRANGEYSNCRESLQRRAVAVLDKLEKQ